MVQLHEGDALEPDPLAPRSPWLEQRLVDFTHYFKWGLSGLRRWRDLPVVGIDQVEVVLDLVFRP
eukprot:3587526-Lingulodinium_polyedra.AAC.1